MGRRSLLRGLRASQSSSGDATRLPRSLHYAARRTFPILLQEGVRRQKAGPPAYRRQASFGPVTPSGMQKTQMTVGARRARYPAFTGWANL